MDSEQKLTKREKKELRKLEWQEKAKKEARNAQVKKYSVWAGAIGIIILVIGGLFLIVSSPSSNTSENVNVPSVSKSDMTTGNPKAKVTLIEYGDFQCPACGAYFPLVKQLIADEKDRMQFVYRFFPLPSTVHPNAFAADLAAYAAFKQGKFFDYHDILYTKQNDWAPLSDPTGTFNDYAKSLKLDVKKFQTDMKSTEAKKYTQDSQDSGNSIGINSTPTFFVNKKQIKNPQNYNDFKQLIDDEFSKK